jgi:hypothetical protein
MFRKAMLSLAAVLAVTTFSTAGNASHRHGGFHRHFGHHHHHHHHFGHRHWRYSHVYSSCWRYTPYGLINVCRRVYY